MLKKKVFFVNTVFYAGDEKRSSEPARYWLKESRNIPPAAIISCEKQKKSIDVHR